MMTEDAQVGFCGIMKSFFTLDIYIYRRSINPSRLFTKYLFRLFGKDFMQVFAELLVAT